MQITERNSLVKRATVEMKALNTLDAGAWRKRLPQVLGPLDDLVENLERCFQMNIGYCILTNGLVWFLFKGEKTDGKLLIYKCGPYYSNNLMLLRVLKHLFNNIILTPIVTHVIGANIDEKSEQYESLDNIRNCDSVKNVESDENQCN